MLYLIVNFTVGRMPMFFISQFRHWLLLILIGLASADLAIAAARQPTHACTNTCSRNYIRSTRFLNSSLNRTAKGRFKQYVSGITRCSAVVRKRVPKTSRMQQPRTSSEGRTAEAAQRTFSCVGFTSRNLLKGLHIVSLLLFFSFSVTGRL